MASILSIPSLQKLRLCLLILANESTETALIFLQRLSTEQIRHFQNLIVKLLTGDIPILDNSDRYIFQQFKPLLKLLANSRTPLRLLRAKFKIRRNLTPLQRLAKLILRHVQQQRISNHNGQQNVERSITSRAKIHVDPQRIDAPPSPQPAKSIATHFSPTAATTATNDTNSDTE